MMRPSARSIAMLGAMGVTVYRITPRATARKADTLATATPMPFRAIPEPALLATPPQSAPITPTRAPLLSKRPASVQRELVLPQAELRRFAESRMYRHLCLLFAPGEDLAIVENAVLSDTALHFECPPAGPVKLGSLALLKTNWRKRREAWLAIRLWRKQLKTRA